MAYRNIFYDIKKSIVHLWTWNELGERTKVETSFEPYLFIENKDGSDAVSIFNTPLKRLKFNNQYERARYVKDTPLTRLFYNINVEQQFLLDTFKNEVDKPNFGNHPLKIFYLDIETYATDHFSTPEEASDPINLITIFDSLEQKYYTWGCKNYSTLEEDVTYFKCKNEQDLLRSFVKFWKNDPPDIVTGWNIHGYDIPYIMNRLTIIFDDQYNKKLSPVERIQFIENASVNKLGRQIDRWVIKGVSTLDYMELYESLCGGKRESMSLNYISEFELGDSKIAIGSTSLSTLADTDWFKFVDYNIQDVRLLIKLENKLKYLKLAQNLSYRGFIPFEKSMGKVSMITGAVAHQALKQKLIIPTFKVENIKQKFAGGFVYEPVPGLYENIVTYDANSLYPNTIITLNISPETKVGKIIERNDGEIKIRLINGKEMSLTYEQFEKIIEKEKLCVTKANILYTQKFKGVVPNLIDRLYQDRVDAKNKMLEAKKEFDNETDVLIKLNLLEQINDNDILSNVYKTLLNSIYGVFSQIYSPLFDIEHAESVTLTGQAVVKQGSHIIYDHAKSNGFSGQIEEICVYQDTDSEFFSFNSIFKNKKINLLNDDNTISDEAFYIIKEYGDVLNKEINEWAKKELKTTDPRYFFKREKICDVALLQAKKFYILHILDKEGNRPKDDEMFEYKGIEVAKAILSKEVKILIKNIIESAILAKERKKAIKLFHDAYENYCNMTPEEIASRKKVNNYTKYRDDYDEDGSAFGKGTPHHVKSSINFNEALKKVNIESKYPLIKNGTKMKHFYCKKNIYGYDSIGFIDQYPKELLSIIAPNYKFMFEKNVIPVVSKIFQIIGWPIPAIGCEEYTDLNDLFS